MQTLQSSPQLFTSQYEGYHHPNNHIQNMKKSSKSVSRYIQSSSMLYSPNKRFIDDTMKHNINTVNSKDYQQSTHFHQNIQKNTQHFDKDQTKSANNPAKFIHEYPQNNLGKVVSRLQNRLDNTQVKIASLTNIVKLLQKYSQTKDDQYQKQKENVLFTKSVGQRVQQIETLQLENKIKEFNAMSKQMRRQIQVVTDLRHKLELNLEQMNQGHGIQYQQGEAKKFTSNRSKKSQKSPTSQGSYLELEDLASAFQEMEQRLREQINKKMEICLKQIKKINTGNGEINGVDQNLFEQQINALNFAINKVENQCTRNKMLVDNQIEELMNRLPSVYHSSSVDYLPRKYLNQPDSIKAVRDKSQERNTKRSSHSRKKSNDRSISKDNRQKSRSNIKSINNNISEKLLDKKKLKQEQLHEAIRRKKQIKEKLKNSHLIKN